MGLPQVSVSRAANSSARSRSAWAMRIRMRPRSCVDVCRHGPSNARRAAPTAASTSSALASGAVATILQVAGSITSSVSALRALTNWPSINSWYEAIRTSQPTRPPGSVQAVTGILLPRHASPHRSRGFLQLRGRFDGALLPADCRVRRRRLRRLRPGRQARRRQHRSRLEIHASGLALRDARRFGIYACPGRSCTSGHSTSTATDVRRSSPRTPMLGSTSGGARRTATSDGFIPARSSRSRSQSRTVALANRLPRPPMTRLPPPSGRRLPRASDGAALRLPDLLGRYGDGFALTVLDRGLLSSGSRAPPVRS